MRRNLLRALCGLPFAKQSPDDAIEQPKLFPSGQRRLHAMRSQWQVQRASRIKHSMMRDRANDREV